MPVIHYNKQNKPFAQQLRREMTRQEKRLWYEFLCRLPQQARRQKQFGDYIVDFYIAQPRLVIELDGSQHYDPEEKAYDARRDEYLSGLGLRVIRFSNLDVDRNFEGVCATIMREMGIGE